MLLLYPQIIGLLGKPCKHFICRIATYPVDKVISSLNNWGQGTELCKNKKGRITEQKNLSVVV